MREEMSDGRKRGKRRAEVRFVAGKAREQAGNGG